MPVNLNFDYFFKKLHMSQTKKDPTDVEPENLRFKAMYR